MITRSRRSSTIAKPRTANPPADAEDFLSLRKSPRNHTAAKKQDERTTKVLGQPKRQPKRQRKQPNQKEKEKETEGEKEKEKETQQTGDALEESSTSPALRRSNRNVNQIRLHGTAQTFYRHLQTLFFSPKSREGYQALGGNRLTLQRVHASPPVYVIDDFLTKSELEYFDSCVERCKFQQSFVDNMELQEMDGSENNSAAKNNSADANISRKRQKRTVLDTTHRTSTFFGFKKLHDTKIRALEQRVADLLGCWVHMIEPLQLVRYLPGQFFNIHHDMGDLMDNDEVKLPKKHLAVKRRLVTVFFYLNTLEPDQGGCTYFPKCNNLRVQPKRGRVVIFSNLTADGLPDPRTIHAGEPVVSQETGFAKYGLNLWICEE